jgi:hypothetical protein
VVGETRLLVKGSDQKQRQQMKIKPIKKAEAILQILPLGQQANRS